MDATAALVAGRPQEVACLLRGLLAAVEQFEDTHIEVRSTVVVLHGANRIFGSVRPTQRGLNVHLNLPHQVEDRRVTRIEPLTKRLTFHRFMLSSPSDLDAQFERWITEAHDAASAGH